MCTCVTITMIFPVPIFPLVIALTYYIINKYINNLCAGRFFWQGTTANTLNTSLYCFFLVKLRTQFWVSRWYSVSQYLCWSVFRCPCLFFDVRSTFVDLYGIVIRRVAMPSGDMEIFYLHTLSQWYFNIYIYIHIYIYITFHGIARATCSIICHRSAR